MVHFPMKDWSLLGSESTLIKESRSICHVNSRALSQDETKPSFLGSILASEESTGLVQKYNLHKNEIVNRQQKSQGKLDSGSVLRKLT